LTIKVEHIGMAGTKVVPDLSAFRMVVPRKQTCLVTGGTGTFGHAFVKRALDDGLFERIVVLSRDELKQQQMKAEFDDQRLRFFLGDVRDKARLVRAFRGVDIVVHCAAYKHVTRSGDSIDEFVKVNILGSMNVIEACHTSGVSRCVALSTDKAVASSTPYGATKSVMSWLFVGASSWGSKCRFSLARYGNILGSRGSVLQTWERQYSVTGSIEMTDPRMTRFWMPIEAAVDLALLALQRMHGGEIFVAKGVDSSTIYELGEQYFPDATVDVVGKRSYEKSNEVLIAKEEADRTHDCGDVYVVLPHSWNWEPGPYGQEFPLVPDGFEYSSCTGVQK
jgi:UDP-N-acetylglucosamine 4,6-dehydratase